MVDDFFERCAGSSTLFAELAGNIFVEGKSSSHIVMLHL